MSSTVLETATATERRGSSRLSSIQTPRALTTCGCGQALEVCRSGHCPRCGVTLRR